MNQLPPLLVLTYTCFVAVVLFAYTGYKSASSDAECL